MNLKVFGLLCIVLMFSAMIGRKRRYQVSLAKCIPLTVCVASMGLFGTYIMFFIENGMWFGQSFFGAVLFFPILLYPVARIFKMQLFDLLDYATPAGMAVMGLFRVNCYMRGCCSGKVLFYSKGIPVYFPIQMVEMMIAFLGAAILIYAERKPTFRNKIYPVCIIAYGAIRFVLNFFRLEQSDFLFGMPAGNLWSLVSIMLGAFLLLFIRKRNQNIEQQHTT